MGPSVMGFDAVRVEHCGASWTIGFTDLVRPTLMTGDGSVNGSVFGGGLGRRDAPRHSHSSQVLRR